MEVLEVTFGLFKGELSVGVELIGGCLSSETLTPPNVGVCLIWNNLCYLVQMGPCLDQHVHSAAFIT